MRKITIFDALDASANQQEDYVIECGQDMRWLLVIEKSGTDGDPKVYIEQDVDGVFVPVEDIFDGRRDFFIVNDSPYGIGDAYFYGKTFRLRSEPNGTTTGTLTAKLAVKTKSV